MGITRMPGLARCANAFRLQVVAVAVLGVALGAAGAAPTPAAADSGGTGPFITQFSMTTTLASTVPGIGDQNPYGIVTVPRSMGCLRAGDILVSNFNNEGPTLNGMPTTGGNQGEGTTIMQFSPDGSHSRLFAQLNSEQFPGGVGLTTALAALPDGFVIVGSLPTTDGTSATMTAGALIILNPCGQVVGEIAGGPINGPWDLASVTTGPITTLFVTNVLNGTVSASPATVDGGTVVRLRLFTAFGRPLLLGERVIADGFPERTDPAALVVGPTGAALGADGNLYVADSVANRIAAIPNAMTRLTPFPGGGKTVTSGGFLNDPLGVLIAPNGHIVSANGADGNLVETTTGGSQLAESLIDNGNGTGSGDLFGIVLAPHASGVLFVDDFDNTLRLFH